MKDKATEVARKRYDRRAPTYDLMEVIVEWWRLGMWRRLLWRKATGKNILEVGVGTGKNIPFYPTGAEVTAIDFSEKMLERARQRAQKHGAKVRLLQMDAQKLVFPDNAFDTVVATCVFCSVPDPILGLKEIRRVVKPGGKVLLLEHVLSGNRFVSWLMNLVNPLVVRMMGANINRRTVENAGKSGLKPDRVIELGFGIFKLIEAGKE